MKSLRVPFAVSVVCLIVAVSGSTATEGFRLSALNPFASRQSDDDGFQLVPRSSRPAPRRPSLVSRIGSSTKSVFTKTYDFLTPWRKRSAMPPTQPRLTGSQRVYNGGSYTTREPEKKSWFARLVGHESEEKPIETPLDFLGQPRPGN